MSVLGSQTKPVSTDKKYCLKKLRWRRLKGYDEWLFCFLFLLNAGALGFFECHGDFYGKRMKCRLVIKTSTVTVWVDDLKLNACVMNSKRVVAWWSFVLYLFQGCSLHCGCNVYLWCIRLWQGLVIDVWIVFYNDWSVM